MKKKLIEQIENVEKIANYSKVKRLLNNPIKYIFAIFYKKFFYPKTKKEKTIEAPLFFGKKMQIALPASTDIYLTGGKSHVSEIKLAKYMINNLNKGDHFLDIGAHYGYFTLLAAEIIGSNGKIMSFEPTSSSYKLLLENTKALKNTTILQTAISNSEENLIFYEFPNLHSEYNASDVSQFENEDWFQKSPPVKVEVQATTIDHITKDKDFNPQMIKIDVEGAEYNAIQGGINYFKNQSPKIVMEYLEPKRKNETHRKALELLLSIGYYSHIITQNGDTRPMKNIDEYLINEKLESDNIVFMKTE